MSQAQHLPMTPEEYLAWEDRQEFKWEFDGFQPVAMNGGTWAHTRIQGNIITALNVRLRGKPCQPCGSDMRVPTMQGRYRYPDALVTCTPQPLDGRDVTDPVVIFEVLSPSTADDDRTVKLGEYQSIPSLRRYIMLEQTRIFATIIIRAAASWEIVLAGPSSMIAMPEIEVDLPLAELYDGLTFPTSPP